MSDVPIFIYDLYIHTYILYTSTEAHEDLHILIHFYRVSESLAPAPYLSCASIESVVIFVTILCEWFDSWGVSSLQVGL